MLAAASSAQSSGIQALRQRIQRFGGIGESAKQWGASNHGR